MARLCQEGLAVKEHKKLIDHLAICTRTNTSVNKCGTGHLYGFSPHISNHLATQAEVTKCKLCCMMHTHIGRASLLQTSDNSYLSSSTN